MAVNTPIQGTAADLNAECERYEALIKECGGIDLQLLEVDHVLARAVPSADGPGVLGVNSIGRWVEVALIRPARVVRRRDRIGSDVDHELVVLRKCQRAQTAISGRYLPDLPAAGRDLEEVAVPADRGLEANGVGRCPTWATRIQIPIGRQVARFTGKNERIGRMVEMHADDRTIVDSVQAGDIVALVEKFTPGVLDLILHRALVRERD